LLDDHLAGRSQSRPWLPALLRATFDVGYFPPNTPP
jgi:hypothetical protein